MYNSKHQQKPISEIPESIPLIRDKPLGNLVEYPGTFNVSNARDVQLFSIHLSCIEIYFHCQRQTHLRPRIGKEFYGVNHPLFHGLPNQSVFF